MSQSKGFKRRKPTSSRHDPDEVPYSLENENNLEKEDNEIEIQTSTLTNNHIIPETSQSTNVSQIFTDEYLLEKTNILLHSIGVDRYFTAFEKLNESASSLFVHVYETVFKTELPCIQRPVDGRKLTREDYIHNCQIVIDSLRNLFLSKELTLGPEVTGDAVVRGSRPVIAQLVDVMTDLVKAHYTVEPMASSLASSTTSKSTKEMESQDQEEMKNETLPIPPEHEQHQTIEPSHLYQGDQFQSLSNELETFNENQENLQRHQIPPPAPISSVKTTLKKTVKGKKAAPTTTSKSSLRPSRTPSTIGSSKPIRNIVNHYSGLANPNTTPSLKSSLDQQHRLLKNFLGSAAVTRTPLSSVNSPKKKIKSKARDKGNTEAMLLASIEEIADEEKRKRIRMLEKAKKENKVKAANMRHNQKLQEIKVAREKERLENNLKSERMKRGDKNLIEFSKVAKQALSVLHEIRRENEKIAKERKRELELGSKDNMERIESLYKKRLEMVREMIEIRQSEEEQEFLSKKMMMNQVLREVNYALDENIMKVKEEEEHNTGKADREQRELHTATMRILGGEDWNAVHKDRFLGNSYLPKVQSAVEGYIRGGHQYHTSTSSKSRKKLLMKKTTTKTTTKGRAGSMRR